IEIPFDVHQPALVELHLFSAELRFEQFRIADHRGHAADNGAVRAEKIVQRYGAQEDEAREESQAKQDDMPGAQQLAVDAELQDLYEIEDQKMIGSRELLMQYFRKGLPVVARKRKCREKRIKVVIFQLMMKMPVAMPTIEELIGLTWPRYSGDRKRAFAP